MRVLIIVFLLSFFPSEIKGQESPLFIIVSCSEGVMLDDRPISVGQIVDFNAKQLTIPKNGYAGVITNEGYAFELKKSISIKKIVDKIHKENQPKSRIGAVHRGSWEDVEIIGAPKSLYANISGDSILLALRDNAKIGSPYIIELKSLFDDLLLTDTIFINWKTYSARKLLSKELAILIQVKTKKAWGTQQHLLKSYDANSAIKLNLDLSRISKDSPHEKEFRLAVCQLNHFYYDHLFLLYQLERSSHQPQNKIFSNYLAQQKKKYQFELFDFHK